MIHLLTSSNIYNLYITELMYHCLKKLASKVWKKSCPNFFIQCIKLEESRSYFPIHPWPFFLC